MRLILLIAGIFLLFQFGTVAFEALNAASMRANPHYMTVLMTVVKADAVRLFTGLIAVGLGLGKSKRKTIWADHLSK